MRILILLSALFANLSNASYNYYRLPRSVQPLHYNLNILTHLEHESSLYFNGNVEIILRVLQPTSNITLHVGQHLVIDQRRMSLVDFRCNDNIEIKCVNHNMAFDYFIIELEAMLRPRQRYVLCLHFSAPLGRSMSGYYVSSYVKKKAVKYLSITQFEPTDARAAFPCFDEPDFKATFNITLGHCSYLNALSNMPLKERIPMLKHEGWTWSMFETTELMPTYLVAFSVNDFQGYAKQTSCNQKRVKFTTWAREASIREQLKYATEIGPRLLNYYEQLFDIKYPLPKMDQLAVPDFSAGAMENWGLITYREAALFYAPDVSSEADKQRVTNIIAHELAHQWFGNLVTMSWWDDLWLNEGFATYIATLGMEKMCCKWNAYEEESLDNMLAILSTDAYCSTRPIHQPVTTANQIGGLFDPITYRKGAVIIRMMHMFIGDMAFRLGLNNYLERHAYGNAKQEDLWQALTQIAHDHSSLPKDLCLQTIMDSWTLQKGYPLIKVRRHYANKCAVISQSRFQLQPEQQPSARQDQLFEQKRQYCWFVPISYTSELAHNFNSTEPQVWLRCTPKGEPLPLRLRYLPGEFEWIILNVQLTAPYRVDYDSCNWRLLIDALKGLDFQQIHVLNRAQLIDDAMTLAWTGQRSYALALELLSYLSQEREYMPWRAALDQFLPIYRIVRQTDQYEIFQKFMLCLIEPIYKQLEGMREDSKQRHHVVHKTLIASWACRLQHADCVKSAMDYWQQLISARAANPVPPDLRAVVYCTAMRNGKAKDWQLMWELYCNSTVASEQRLMLQALGCTPKECLLQRYVQLIFSRKSLIRKQDALLVLGSIIRNEIGYRIAKQYYMQHFQLLYKYFWPNIRELASLLVHFSQQMSTEQELQQLTVLSSSRLLQRHTSRSCQRALEQAELNLAWRKERLLQFIGCLNT